VGYDTYPLSVPPCSPPFIYKLTHKKRKEVISMTEHDKFQASGMGNEDVYGSQQYGETGTLKDKVRQGFEQTREQSKRAVETVGYQVEERPLISLLIAFGAGLLIGMMLSGVRRGGPGQINKRLQEGTGPLAM
jgi:hypothetical protein